MMKISASHGMTNSLVSPISNYSSFIKLEICGHVWWQFRIILHPSNLKFVAMFDGNFEGIAIFQVLGETQNSY
jgi:hypothetical protein